jgi:hypothetical protein
MQYDLTALLVLQNIGLKDRINSMVSEQWIEKDVERNVEWSLV